ncbi:MAG: T9SS type A sorting domain-containing protein [Bacteroidota bacterium]
MKRLIIILLTVSMGSWSLNATTFTSIQTGNWADGTTWDQSGGTPVAGDVIIISNNHIITVNSEEYAKSISIGGTDADNYGTLNITTDADLTTSDNITVYGKLTMDDGILNHGTSSGDKLTINGSGLGSSCLLSISGGTINISRYFNMSNASSFAMSGGTININSSGGTSSTDIFYIPAGTTFTMTAGTINILNGNLGSGVAMKYNPTTSNVSGGTINFINTKNYETITLVADAQLFDINSSVGTGDTLLIQNMPSTTGGFSCHDFTISTGVVLINQGFGMTVTGALTNNLSATSLVIESTSLGNGSLIASTVTGEATVQRYIEGYSSNNDGWHEISNPVNNMSIDGSDFDPGSTDDLYAWSESGNIWLNHKVSDNNITNFENGQGYIAAYESTAIKNFIGALNNSDIIFNNISVGDGGGWHLLGNPFASALKWNEGSWAISNIGGVAKLWDESAGNYTDVSANGYIPSTNGFFVQATSSTNTITIPSAACYHNSNATFKSTDTIGQETLIVRVSGDANSYYDMCTIGFSDIATELWDVELDSRKLAGSEKAPQLWTVSSEEELSTNFLPPIIQSYILPLNFHAGVNGNYELFFDNMESFLSGSTIMLEDKQTDKIIYLNDNPYYSFSARIADNPSRFILHFYGVTNNDESEVYDSQYHIYTYNNKIYIKATTENTISGNLIIYNTIGQLVFEDQIHNSELYSSPTNLPSGYYIASLTTHNQIINTKILINNN